MQVCFLYKKQNNGKEKSFDLFDRFLLTITFFSFSIFFNRQLQNVFNHRFLWDFVSKKWVLSVEMHQMQVNIFWAQYQTYSFFKLMKFFGVHFLGGQTSNRSPKCSCYSPLCICTFPVEFFLFILWFLYSLTSNQSGYWAQEIEALFLKTLDWWQ